MLYGILAIFVLPVVCTGLVLAGRGDVLRSVICVVAPTVLVFSMLVKRRHHCAIRSEGTLLGITNLCITPCHGFVNPGELPWYVGWSCYDVEANDPAGLRREYMAFLTWTWFGFLGIEVSLSTVEDRECYDTYGNRIYRSSLIEESEKRDT